MTTWTTSPSGDRDPESPVTTSLINLLYNNPIAITEKAAGAPVLANGYVVNAMMAGSAIKQGNLSTALQQNSGTVASGGGSVNITYTGGAYSMLAGWSSTPGNLSVNAIPSSSYLWGMNFYNGSGTNTPYKFQSRYITASPPYDLGDGEIPLFIYALIDSVGNIVAIDTAIDPAWANNGPTNIRPDFYSEAGVGFQKKCIITPEINNMSRAERVAAIRSLPVMDIEVTQAIKNADMDIVPHPYVGTDLAGLGLTVILLDPVSDCVRELAELRDAGDDIHQIINDGQLIIGNTPLPRSGPGGLMIPSVRWR